MPRSLTWQQDTIMSVLEVCSRVKAVEEKLFELFKNKTDDVGTAKEQFNYHVNYNDWLEKLLVLIKGNLGKAVLPSVIPETIEDRGPLFLDLDPEKIASSFNWSSERLNNFKKLRYETISLWRSIKEYINHETVEESDSVSSNDNVSE
uniref:Uncharacterized protein n=1 Tax=Graphocephala atropunctata TaxID=36148 RepID=A0A1B6MS85_9HEMI